MKQENARHFSFQRTQDRFSASSCFDVLLSSHLPRDLPASEVARSSECCSLCLRHHRHVLFSPDNFDRVWSKKECDMI
jgi:hypothetical protein